MGRSKETSHDVSKKIVDLENEINIKFESLQKAEDLFNEYRRTKDTSTKERNKEAYSKCNKLFHLRGRLKTLLRKEEEEAEVNRQRMELDSVDGGEEEEVMAHLSPAIENLHLGNSNNDSSHPPSIASLAIGNNQINETETIENHEHIHVCMLCSTKCCHSWDEKHPFLDNKESDILRLMWQSDESFDTAANFCFLDRSELKDHIASHLNDASVTDNAMLMNSLHSGDVLENLIKCSQVGIFVHYFSFCVLMYLIDSQYILFSFY